MPAFTGNGGILIHRYPTEEYILDKKINFYPILPTIILYNSV